MVNMAWISYTQLHQPHTVQGNLLVYPDFFSPQLQNQRDVLVWLPTDYASSERRYPVFYLHDGQNLFDAFTSYGGVEWQIDESMQILEKWGHPAIIVGINNRSEERYIEYSPYPLPEIGAQGQGDLYISFLTDTLMPIINQQFRTLTTPEHTGIAGSSMGGLISLYGFLTRPQVFGLCGCFSPAYWIGEQKIFAEIEQIHTPHGKVYLDVGGREGEVLENPRFGLTLKNPDEAYRTNVAQMASLLSAKGYQMGHSLLYIEDKYARHNEIAWASRFLPAMQFLLG
jgi:predicted alpha/beta superfamily hydrolase